MSEKEPNKEGRLAYEMGELFNSCPYPPDSIDAVEWEGAWLEASDEYLESQI